MIEAEYLYAGDLTDRGGLSTAAARKETAGGEFAYQRKVGVPAGIFRADLCPGDRFFSLILEGGSMEVSKL